MTLFGVMVGFAFGMATARHIQSLLYGVKASDASMLAAPALIIFFIAVLAAAPAMPRAARIDQQ